MQRPDGEAAVRRVACRCDVDRGSRRVIDAGWTVIDAGPLLVAARAQGGLEVPAKTTLGIFEYHQNDVHLGIDDLRARPDFLSLAAARAILFAREMLRLAGPLVSRDAAPTAMARVFVDTQDEDFELQDLVIRFFTRRGAPDWLDDLEAFRSEAVAVLDVPELRAPEGACSARTG